MLTDATAYLTVQQVAERLQVTPKTVRVWIGRGELPALDLGGRRTGYRIARADLDAFEAARQTARSNGHGRG
jgi:excisionase family DNA binding protein